MIFTSSGCRGIIGDQFTKKSVQKVSQAIADMIDKKEIVIGYDYHDMSALAAEWSAEVFSANGVLVHFSVEPSPTPLTILAVVETQVQLGIMFISDHHQSLGSGMKFFNQDGQDIDQKDLDLIERKYQQTNLIQTMKFLDGIDQELIKAYDVSKAYNQNVLDKIDVKTIKKQQFNILLYTDTSLNHPLIALLEELNCNLTYIDRCYRRDEDINEMIYHRMVKDSFDLAFVFHGFTSAIDIFDHKGNFIAPHLTMALLYEYIMKYRNQLGPAIRTVATSHMIDQIADQYQQTVYETPVGLSYIVQAAKEHNALIAGESSGTLAFKNHLNTSDQLYSILITLEMLANTDSTLADLIKKQEEAFGKLHFITRNYKYSRKKKERIEGLLFPLNEDLKTVFAVKDIHYLDGITITFEDSNWLNLRFSQGENLFRMSAEGANFDDVQEKLLFFEDYLGLKTYRY